jgi:hypothetical protein
MNTAAFKAVRKLRVQLAKHFPDRYILLFFKLSMLDLRQQKEIFVDTRDAVDCPVGILDDLHLRPIERVALQQ